MESFIDGSNLSTPRTPSSMSEGTPRRPNWLDFRMHLALHFKGLSGYLGAATYDFHRGQDDISLGNVLFRAKELTRHLGGIKVIFLGQHLDDASPLLYENIRYFLKRECPAYGSESISLDLDIIVVSALSPGT